ncbi:uncharacterized protein LOC108864822 [Galendromus occidentalis]|uniref:Uncharacterized protein LOC108864822 n=1 Tax=Galendromus occidentalis TaxID=34638 RepID=A0AAJ7WIR2_9ACAR|nr:uncharacterized protein LOC108864822 [Galendromus occidentalis]
MAKKSNPKNPPKALQALLDSGSRFRNQIDEIIDSIEDLESADPKFPDNQQPDAISLLLKGLFEKLQSLEDGITIHPDVANSESEQLDMEDIDRFELRFRRATAAIDAAHSRRVRAVDTTAFFTPARPRVRFQEENNENATRNERAAQRPEIFKGDRLKFRTFMKQFEIFVSKSPRAADCERLMALRKFVPDEPKQLVDALELTDSNYKIAFTTLEENYSRVDVDRERLLSELRNLPKVPSLNAVAELRKLVIQVQTNTKVLESLGVRMDSIAVMVQSSLTASLPPALRQLFKQWRRIEVTRQSREPPPAIRTPSSTSTPAHRLFDITTEISETRCDTDASEEPIVELQRTIRYALQHIRDYEDSGYLDAALGTSNKNEAQAPKKPVGNKKLLATVAAANGRTSNARAEKRIRPCLFCNTADHNSSRFAASFSIEARREILKKQKRCPKCFLTEHAKPGECRGPRVSCNVCKSSQHHTSMHAPEDHTRPASSATPVISNVVGGISDCDEPTVMLTAQAFILHGARKIPCRIFFDHGSGLAFISPNTRRLLMNAQPLSNRNLVIDTFKSQDEFRANRFRVVLQSTFDEHIKIPIFAYERAFPVNPRNPLSPTSREAVRKFAEEHQLADASLLSGEANEQPGIIIGLDQIYRVLLFDAPKSVDGSLVALNSRLGWTVGGPLSCPQAGLGRVTSVSAVCCVATLSQQSKVLPADFATSPAKLVEKLWRLDTIGVEDQSTSSRLSSDESSALQQFEQSVTYDGKRYSVSFPKRDSITSLQNNRNVALRRLRGKLRQLMKSPEKYSRYHEEIMEFVKNGHAYEIDGPALGCSNEAEGTYHMPHHEVTASLNENLLPGPNLNPDLVSLLMNFRLHAIAVSADIKAAYMRTEIHDADRRLFRFLWRAPGEEKIRTFEMKKVTWGAASSGFLLAATIRGHLKKVEPQIGERLGDHLYADDFLQSFPNQQQAIEYADRLRNALQSADMALAKWKSNSKDVTKHLIDVGVKEAEFQSSPSNLFRVLGIIWSPTQDTLSFSIPSVDPKWSIVTAVTKRAALSITASVYDPLGLLIPYTIWGKLLIQRLWSTKLQWDDPIPIRSRVELLEWSEELSELPRINIERQYSNVGGDVQSYHLHVFADASPSAFACAAYIEYRVRNGDSGSSLLMCKSRLAPIDKPPTLPRLELLAALLAVRLKRFIVERIEVQFETIRFYTDSTITYHWVTGSSPGRWKAFIHNRVEEIQQESRVDQWYHVQGEHNIADLATRGISARTLRGTLAWWHGPRWLHLPEGDKPISRPRLEDNAFEAAKEEIRHTSAPTTVAERTHPLDLELFSSASRAVRVMANALRFIRTARRQPYAAVAEIHQVAERQIIRSVQAQYFRKEIHATEAEGPFFTHDEKNPIVLPGESRFARLLIYDAHRVNAHFGVATILNQIRRRFWITRGRQVIQAILNKCVVCKRRQRRPADQIGAPLPEPRVTLYAPFQTTGIDFCGPFYTRTETGTQETYVALFTCAATRAVHLEMTPFMSTPSTHLALCRFLAEHPACLRFVSDNGRSFVRAASDIKRLFNSVRDPEVRSLLEGRSIEWSFNSPCSAWHGGFFERLVKTTLYSSGRPSKSEDNDAPQSSLATFAC